MSDFFGKLKSGANKVAFEADKMGRVNRAQGELDKIKGQISTQFAKLGEMVYRQYSNQEAVSPALAEICQAVARLEQQVALKGEELNKLKAETFGAPAGSSPMAAPVPTPVPAPAPVPSPAPIMAVEELTPASTTPEVSAQPAAVHCTNCGREIPPGVKFCPDCGTKI